MCVASGVAGDQLQWGVAPTALQYSFQNLLFLEFKLFLLFDEIFKEEGLR